jgi:carboxylesterase type B
MISPLARGLFHRAIAQSLGFAAVAKTGNPNGGGLPQWPAYRSPDYRLLDFGDTVTLGSNAHSPQIDFFQRAFESMRTQRSMPTAPK